MRLNRYLGQLILILFLAGCSRNPPNRPQVLAPPTPTGALPAATQPRSVQSSPTPTLLPVAIPLENLNVRAGPAITYEKVGLLEAGSEAPLIGQNEDGDWWQVDYPDAPEGTGWIAAEFAEARNPDALAPPTTPIAPLTPTRALTAGLTVTTPRPQVIEQLILDVSPTTIHTTECARLRYAAEGLSEVRLNEQPLPAGNIVASDVVCPETTTTYLITATNSSGQVISRSVSLTVIASTPTAAPNSGSTLAASTGGCQFALANLGTASPDECRFSPDGRWIAAPSADGSLWIIDMAGQTFDQALDPAGQFVVTGHLLWSPNGEYIAFSTAGTDGSGSGVGILRAASRSLTYLGPDARQGQADAAARPRWTQDGRLIITWFRDGLEEPGVVSILGPLIYAPDGPVPLELETELNLSAGGVGQQFFPWLPGRLWRVGASPSYEVDTQ